MTPHARHNLLALLMLTAPLAACAQQADAPPAPVAAAAPAVAQSAAPQLVTGLPDFTQLVEQVGPGVVNVEATVGSRRTAQAEEEADIPEIFRRMLPPGFQIPGGPGQQGPQRRGTSMGSGFIISADGYVLTNHHVVDGADEVKVTLPDRRELTAKVVGSDQQYDVALLKVEAKGLPTVRIGNSATLKPGQWVVAIGSPLGLDHSVTAGIVSAVGRSASAEQRYVPFIQTDVAINQGNSGGPLLNTRGEVVGINSQIFSVSGGYMGISFAIPIDLAMGAVDQLKATGRVSRGQLGVQVGAVTSDAVKGFGLPDNRGALVNDVVSGSPAAKAGIGPGDVIRSVNGRAINDSSDLPPIIGAMAPGSKVTLNLLRDGRARDVSVTLSELDEGESVARSAPAAPDAPAAPAGRNVLGIQTQALDANSRKQLGLESGDGVLVSRVENAAAREAGLSPGMVILQVGRNKVNSPAALDRELAAAKPGDTVMLLVRNRGVTRFLAVTVEKG
ncbi:Do family serine endopeptidase [Pseudoxanthomonas sp. PXM02]|uniref:Do family serine endopeptidase n=1 Tax=Pseudoxanthomonas sp. PXM02 TaxID=2769294 RepID=UPI001784F7D3|nr:Do family serine endopeptidase [Pseudoxanthomonas sp. PXM02]MBD9477854.1 Do family serine endopeptidase [Pseudoxanthomonas sp. PXM02]